MADKKPTGHVEIRKLEGGDAFYAKLKLPGAKGERDTQPRRKLGKVWTKRTQPPAGYLTRRQAEARLAAILAGDDPLVNIAPSHISFGQACDEHVRWLADEKQRKRSTISDYESVVRHDLIPFFGESTPIESITTIDVEALKDALLARVSHRTAQKVLLLLHAILKRAQRKGWVKVNPCAAAERVTVRASDDFNVLSVEQVHTVARAAATPQLTEMIRVAAFTGLRLGELLALRWRHIDFANRLVHVQRNYVGGEEGAPKSHKRRSLPLLDQAMVALDALSRREHFTALDDLVFPNMVGEHALGDGIRDAFYAALIAARLGHLRESEHPIVFHDLRHTFGTLCAAAAIDVTSIQRWMGHADIQTTQRYMHYVPAHDDAARLTAAFGGTVAESAPEPMHGHPAP